MRITEINGLLIVVFAITINYKIIILYEKFDRVTYIHMMNERNTSYMISDYNNNIVFTF